MLSGSQVGYARMTRRWMAPIRREMDEQGLADRPLYFVSSNTHWLVNLLTETARAHEPKIVRFIDERGPDYLRDELQRSARAARRAGQNFLYYGARLSYMPRREDGVEWQKRIELERAVGITHLSSRTPARFRPGDRARARPGGWTPARPDRRSGSRPRRP